MHAVVVALLLLSSDPSPPATATPPSALPTVVGPVVPAIVLPNGMPWPTGLGRSGPAWFSKHSYRQLGVLYHQGSSYDFRREYDYPWSMPSSAALGYGSIPAAAPHLRP